MASKSKSLNQTVKKSLLAMIALTVLLTPASGFTAERDGSVLFFSLEDLQQTLSNPTAPSFSDWSSNFAWRNQREQDQPGPGIDYLSRGHGPGEGAPGLPVGVLGPHLDPGGPERVGHRGQGRGRGADGDPDAGQVAAAHRDGPGQGPGFPQPQVHLPVPDDRRLTHGPAPRSRARRGPKICAQASWSAATPGRSRPSRYSRNAPPPVER
jgi:hypothetical protein